MARDTGDESGNGNRSAEEAALSARLQRLGERLDQHKGPSRPAETRSGSKSDPSALARGFRLSTELVAGVLVGAFIGWALDKWLGTSPWGMIVFLLLGFAAGVINVMRAAGVSERARDHRRDRDWQRMRTAAGDGRSDSSIRNPQPRAARPHRRARDRVHQFGAVHGDRGGRHRGAAARRERRRARWCRAGCNRSRSCPTNSSPTR